MSLETPQHVLLELAGDVATITLNRPEKRNSLNALMVEELLACFRQASLQSVRLIVFKGVGKAFSGGFDFSNLENESDEVLAYRFLRIETLLQEVSHSRISTLAFAQGPAFGAGADLFTACHQRVAEPGSTFRFPGLQFGVVLGTRRLQQRVGTDRARKILQESATISASQAYEYGLVTNLCSQEEWAEVAQATAVRATILAPAAVDDLNRVLAPRTHNPDFADLARSVSHPGLQDRIYQYLKGNK